MQNPSVMSRCTAQRYSGQFCDMPSMVDVPFPICRKHAEQAYHRWQSELDARVSVFQGPHEDYVPPQNEHDPQPLESSVVYYVRIGDHVKIGTSINLKARLSSLNALPDSLLATEPGDRTLEAQRHAEFSAERIYRNRELFNPSRRLLEHIASIGALQPA